MSSIKRVSWIRNKEKTINSENEKRFRKHQSCNRTGRQVTAHRSISTRDEYPCHRCRLRDECQQPKVKSVNDHRRREHGNNRSSTHLDARLACQATLHVREGSTDLVAHRRLAVLGSHSLGTAGGRRAVGASAADAGALGGQRAFAAVAVVADAAGMRCCLPGGGGGAGDWVSGSGLGDAGVLLRLLACQARHEAGLCGSGGGACASHGE